MPRVSRVRGLTGGGWRALGCVHSVAENLYACAFKSRSVSESVNLNFRSGGVGGGAAGSTFLFFFLLLQTCDSEHVDANPAVAAQARRPSFPPTGSETSRNHLRGFVLFGAAHPPIPPPPAKTANMTEAAGKQHYLQANPSHGARQLQTLHVIPPSPPPPPPPGDTPLCLLSRHFISPPYTQPFPLPPSPACHSLSLAPRAKLRRGEAATALRNSVIYWQFPSQVSGILYLNTSAATLNKTALSIYISAAPGHAAHGTRCAGAVKYLPPLNVNLVGAWGGGWRGVEEKNGKMCLHPPVGGFSEPSGCWFWEKFRIGTWNVSGYRDVASGGGSREKGRRLVRWWSVGARSVRFGKIETLSGFREATGSVRNATRSGTPRLTHTHTPPLHSTVSDPNVLTCL